MALQPRFRSSVVDQSERWLGLKSSNKSNAIILQIYNSNTPLPRGYKVKDTDNWCATFASAVFISAGCKDIFPIECSCGKMIEKAKSMGIWVERDSFVPGLGDCVMYDWDDTGKGDDTGWPEHVGIVTYVNEVAGYMVVTEGNYSKSVKKRTININGRYIRGFITPKFDANYDFEAEDVYIGDKSISTVAHEVIAGLWSSGEKRRRLLSAAGYDYRVIQNEVNKILNTPSRNTKITAETKGSVETKVKPTKTDVSIIGNYVATANLYLREGAGTNKKAMKLMPNGTKVFCNGNYSVSNGVKWYYITAEVDGISYTGFSCSKYLSRR